MNQKHDNTDICRRKLAEKGISFETPEEEDLFTRVITSALETRIGNAITQRIGPEKSAAFSRCNAGIEAAQWLEKNCPDYRDIVAREQDKILLEVEQYKDVVPGLIFQEQDPMRRVTIEELDLGVRSISCLRRAGIRTVGDLLDYGDYSKIRNLGSKCVAEIDEKLEDLRCCQFKFTPEDIPAPMVVESNDEELFSTVVASIPD